MDLMMVALLVILSLATLAFFYEAWRDGRMARLNRGLRLADDAIAARMEYIARREFDTAPFTTLARRHLCDPRLMAAALEGRAILTEHRVDFPMDDLILRSHTIYWRLKGDPKSRVGSKARR